MPLLSTDRSTTTMARNDSVTSSGSEPRKIDSDHLDAMQLDSPASSFSSTMDIDSPNQATNTPSSQTDTTNGPTSALLYSTGHDLKAFHLFPYLKPSLRAHIWLLASPAPRTHFLELYGHTHFTTAPKIRYIPPLPPLFHTSRESRTLTIAHQGGELVRLTSAPPSPPFYFHPARDILFLSSRFAPGQTSTETLRLRALAALLPAPVRARLRRVVVTYSGVDSYEHIGPVFRAFARLEICYLAIVDWWSGTTLRRRVRRGRPKAGNVAERIARAVERAEEEETDDEEESGEEWVARVGKRAERRIVECELRLDE
jgi:hypothetical protein